MGNIFTIIHTFFPNQNAWAFRSLFSVVFSSFLSKRIFRNITIIILDGDSSEYTQIDAAIKKVMPNSIIFRSGWHVGNRGWKKHCGNAMHKKMTQSEITIYKKCTFDKRMAV